MTGTQMPEIDWYDVRKDLLGVNLLIAIGGRGIGKTYSALDWLQEDGKNMLYIRNQLDEIIISCTYKGNPFKKLNRDKGYNYTFEKSGGMYNIIDINDEGEKIDRGLGIALSVAGKVKGFDLSDIDAFVYDEFIPDPDLVLRFNPGEAFLRFYETVARNREILGENPLKGILLSNSEDIRSEVLVALGIADKVELMARQGIKKMTVPEKGIRIVLPEAPELMKRKMETALYKAAADNTAFIEKNIENKFTGASFQHVKKRKLSEYTGVCGYEGLYIYRHKSRNEYYVCESRADVDVYTALDTKDLFLRRWWPYRDLMLNGTFIYSSYGVKARIKNLFKL